MNVTINVDETMFKEILEKELLALKPEELHEVLVKSIEEYFKKDESRIRNLIFTGSYGSYDTASEFTKAAISSCDFSSLQPIVDEYVDLLNNKFERLLKEIIVSTVSETLTNMLRDRFTMKGEMTSAINQILYEERQKNRGY